MSFAFELPGFVYDPIKKKYFPTPSSSSSQAGSSRSSERRDQPTKRHFEKLQKESRKGKERAFNLPGGGGTVGALWEMKRGNIALRSLDRSREDLSRAALLGFVSKESSYLPLSTPEAFVTCLAAKDDVVLAGDSKGSIHSLNMSSSSGWMFRINLMNSPITSINIHQDRFIATSFGPSPGLLHAPLDQESTPMFIIRPQKATDVWSSLFLPSGGIVLGCDSQILSTPSPIHSPHLQVNATDKSSVLCMSCLSPSPSTFLAGLRSGSVKLFDTRSSWQGGRGMHPQGQRQKQNLGEGGEVIRLGTPVVGMVDMGGGLVCCGGMNGDLNIYDLRFLPKPSRFSPSPTLPSNVTKAHSTMVPCTSPLISLPSHQNTYSTGLPLLYHASSRTILASGQDRRIRAWDARTGAIMCDREDQRGILSESPRDKEVRGLVELHGGREIGLVDGDRWQVFG
ncbi:WD40/YVTN repeat-like-containing domain [Phaffia rhodozyma]|uniref:WD40/YVTN repeat-like-containing domain n=1 Tax=Phaffia rhodozyma TaxID=264483 RepID=A0A0F7SRX0_PHARH|nr:WD40/YVTN repeat-like-containing domain [Phaffia rhodozyma]